MRGLNVMYDFMRRPSMAFDPNVIAIQRQQQIDPTSPSLSIPPPTESPMTPLPENLQTYEIDDEFNLPISVAIVMLLTYMLFGACIYCTWEGWTFFESFYFVFISISTIGEWHVKMNFNQNENSIFQYRSLTFIGLGFGDFVPAHPIYMMASIIYLIFGLALTSMAINVVQLKLSDHFRQASTKLIGMAAAEAASQGSAPQSPNEILSVYSTNSLDNNGIARSTNDTLTADNNTVNTNSKML